MKFYDYNMKKNYICPVLDSIALSDSPLCAGVVSGTPEETPPAELNPGGGFSAPGRNKVF